MPGALNLTSQLCTMCREKHLDVGEGQLEISSGASYVTKTEDQAHGHSMLLFPTIPT